MAEVLGMHQDLFAGIVCAQLLVALSLLFFIIYCLSTKTMEGHAMLAIIGFHVIWVTAVLWYFQLIEMYMIIVFLFVAIIFAAMGTGMALMEYGCQNNVHSWFGILAFIFGVLTLLIGTVLTFTVEEYTKNFLFVFLACLTLLLSTLALITGMTMGYAEWASCFMTAFHIFIVVLYTALAISFALFVLYSNDSNDEDATD